MAQKRIDFISFEEFQQLYKAAKKKETKLILLLGFGSGLRISEIIGYQRKTKRRTNKQTKEVTFIEDKSTIPPLTADKINLESHQIRIDDAKGGKWRTTVTPPLLTEDMLKLLPLKLKRRAIQERIYQLSEKVLGKRISIHTLRHGFGNYMVNVKNVPLPIVQQMMGHSRLDTTGIYTKANPEQAIKTAWAAMMGEVK